MRNQYLFLFLKTATVMTLKHVFCAFGLNLGGKLVWWLSKRNFRCTKVTLMCHQVHFSQFLPQEGLLRCCGSKHRLKLDYFHAALKLHLHPEEYQRGVLHLKILTGMKTFTLSWWSWSDMMNPTNIRLRNSKFTITAAFCLALNVVSGKTQRPRAIRHFSVLFVVY